MLPLLSITSPMLTGISSRLKTDSFCSTLSSRTRKFSSFNPSTNRLRSSSTVVCNTTRFTSTRILGSVGACWPGGSGCELGTEGICESAGKPDSASAHTATIKDVGSEKRAAASVTRRVVASLRVNVERREPLGCAQLDLDFSPACVMCLIAWPISQDILITQLHADL